MALSPGDPHSFARPEFARVTHTRLKLNVDFNRKILKGKVTLTIEKEPSITEIILDNYKLVISNVTNASTKSPLKYRVGLHHTLGSSFKIQLPQTVEDTVTQCNIVRYKIRIKYETSPTSPALHWLTSEQTADGTHPFLLGYGKFTYARALFPCQDTPSVKFTYSAEISVPRDFRVLMSARLEYVTSSPHKIEYEFLQTNPVPSYAVVLAVGSLQKAQLNNPSLHVFAEKKFINESIKTFASVNIENMLQIAENICGPYSWGMYDICVLPPSISHFKIECPCLTFMSASLLGGDNSLFISIVQNISQSWAGNLVTCANYEHLWLNKSFAIFISRNIMRKMLINIEIDPFFNRKVFNELLYTIKNSTNRGLLKSLVPNLTGMLPNVTVQYVLYEIGYILLSNLECTVGASEFESFLKSYFKKFKLKSIKTYDWIQYLYLYFSNKNKILNSIPWNNWFYDILCPQDIPMGIIESKSFYLAKEWARWDVVAPVENVYHLPRDFTINKNFCDIQKILLLNHLHTWNITLSVPKMKIISKLYDFDTPNTNCEIRFAWLRVCIKHRWTRKVKDALEYAPWFFYSPQHVYPIFQDLSKWAEVRPMAIQTYIRNKKKMLYKTQRKVESILKLNRCFPRQLT